MLLQLDYQIRQAYAHAEHCAERARCAADARERNDWLFMEERWLVLARSLEFSRRLERFTHEAARRRRSSDS
ncbi:MAG TPA: hypothetical protein VH684_06500 [Xanthobacteraceae bacterium]|jgi:hypothetical protein